LAPGLAAFTGIGLVALWKLYVGNGKSAFLLPLSLAASALMQFIVIFLYYPSWNGWLAPVIAIICAAGAAMLTIIRLHKFKSKLAISCFIISAAALFIAPAMWSATPMIYGTSMGDPQAGPQIVSSPKINVASTKTAVSKNLTYKVVKNNRKIRLTPVESNANRDAYLSNDYLNALKLFLVKNRGKEKYIVAVTKSDYAEEIILDTGLPVMAIGGYTGDDPILTVSQFARLAKSGDVRYFLVENSKKPAGTLKIIRWVKSNGRKVPLNDIMGIRTGNSDIKKSEDNQFTLYDLKPRDNIKTNIKLA
jgi:hypothetical protein